MENPKPQNEYQLRKQEKIDEQKKIERRKKSKKFLKTGFWLLFFTVLIGGLVWYINKQPSPNETDSSQMCIQHQNLALHIHQKLTIKINGVEQKIPANTGITATCMRPLHTHDETGTIHVEFPTVREPKLGEFFKIWGKEFNSTTILDKHNGLEGQVKMFVNGQPNTDFENYILKDRDVIEIIFE